MVSLKGEVNVPSDANEEATIELATNSALIQELLTDNKKLVKTN